MTSKFKMLSAALLALAGVLGCESEIEGPAAEPEYSDDASEPYRPEPGAEPELERESDDFAVDEPRVP